VLLAGAPDTPEIAQQIGDAFGHLQSTRGNVLWIEEMLPRQQVRQVLSHATVFACPSVYEPLGIVNLEAMASETAVVASAVGGIPEVVVDGVTCYLVPYDPANADDPSAVAAFEEDFAAKINAVTRDPDKARAFGLAGRQRCIDEFDWSKIAAETVEVYRRAREVHQS
jgi:starch synthase